MDFQKADLFNRFIAALLDGLLAFAISFIPGIGWVIAMAYLLLKDGFFDGASAGKMLMKLKVRTMEDQKADYVVSAKRNVIFALPYLLTVIPFVGPILMAPLGLFIYILEAYSVFVDPLGRRLGDKFANSIVIAE